VHGGSTTASRVVAVEQRWWCARRGGRKQGFNLAPTRLNRGWRRWTATQKLRVGTAAVVWHWVRSECRRLAMPLIGGPHTV
jgi:hypothetical protein